MPALDPSPQHITPETWDTIVIGNHQYPGEATVEITKKFKFEEKKAAGKSGEDLTFKGVETAKLKIKIRVTLVFSVLFVTWIRSRLRLW